MEDGVGDEPKKTTPDTNSMIPQKHDDSSTEGEKHDKTQVSPSRGSTNISFLLASPLGDQVSSSQHLHDPVPREGAATTVQHEGAVAVSAPTPVQETGSISPSPPSAPVASPATAFLGYLNYNPSGENDLPQFVREHNATLSFPEKLMLMMTHVERKIKEGPPITWILDGRAFCINNRDQLAQDVLPLFFGKGKFTSFTRKLYRWGFRQISVPSSNPSQQQSKHDMNFGHEYFQRDNKQLMISMRSITAAGKRRQEQKQRQKEQEQKSAEGAPALSPFLGLMGQHYQGRDDATGLAAGTKRPSPGDNEAAMSLKRAALFASNQRLTQETPGGALVPPPSGNHHHLSQAMFPGANAPFINPILLQQAAMSFQGQQVYPSMLQQTQQFFQHQVQHQNPLPDATQSTVPTAQNSLPATDQQRMLQQATTQQNMMILQQVQQNAAQQQALQTAQQKLAVENPTAPASFLHVAGGNLAGTSYLSSLAQESSTAPQHGGAPTVQPPYQGPPGDSADNVTPPLALSDDGGGHRGKSPHEWSGAPTGG